ncbi:MAG: hypothetical protein RID91_12785 [Azospirillaceae bacterium]
MTANDHDVLAAAAAARAAQQRWLARSLPRALARLAGMPLRALVAWRRAIERETALRRLEALDDRMLSDLGLLRGTIEEQLLAAEAAEKRRRVAGAAADGAGTVTAAANQDAPAPAAPTGTRHAA